MPDLEACVVLGCPRPARYTSRGWCAPHYHRHRRYGDPLGEPTLLEPEQRFWAKVDKCGPVPAHAPELGPCWLWTGCRSSGGYGYLTVARRQHKAHRRAWEMQHGPVPAGLAVLHRCDNPPCVNTAHLFLGTLADNNRDRDRKGRGPAGVRNGKVKLRPEEAEAIRRAAVPGRGPYDPGNTRELAERYGVSLRYIRSIATGKAGGWAA